MNNMSNMERKRHELYEDIRDHVLSVLESYLIDTDKAEQIAVALIHRFSSHWGGSTFSFPKDVAYHLSQRNMEIWNKFQGNNHRELALEFGITENAIYQIVKDMREMLTKKNQPSLF